MILGVGGISGMILGVEGEMVMRRAIRVWPGAWGGT